MADHFISYGTTGAPHPYHMVRPSAWPFFGAFAGGLFALGMVLFMHKQAIFGVTPGIWGPIAGLVAILTIMFLWWKDVIYEAVVERAHTKTAETGLRLGMGLFIASEVMFFVAFFWAFFDASIFVADVREVLNLEFTKGQWPPAGMTVIDPFDLPFLMTMILLLSGCAVTWGHHAILEGERPAFKQALWATVGLGVLFLFFQGYEYVHAPFKFTDGIYASTFFMATGFHGFHVLVGTLFLLVCTLRAVAGQFTTDRHFGFEAAAWYWHFVDVVWLFLFVGIYWWGNSGGHYAAH